MLKKVVAVVVTYNRKNLLRECINSLLIQSYSPLDILIIDNASTDGTKDLVSSFSDDRVYYKNTGKNLGGAGGFQFGVREAAQRGYDYLWLMDDDSIPTPDALNVLMKEASQKGSFGFMCSKVLWKDHSICKMNIPKISLNRKLDNFEGSPKRVIMGTFVSFLVPLKIVDEVGLPIKEFFIWADDLEYSRRISRKYSCYFVPASIVIHKSPSNVGSSIVDDSPDRFNRYKCAYRNEVYVYRREGLAGWNHLILKTILHTCKVLLKSKDHKKERLHIIFSATRKGFSFHPQIEYLHKNN